MRRIARMIRAGIPFSFDGRKIHGSENRRAGRFANTPFRRRPATASGVSDWNNLVALFENRIKLCNDIHSRVINLTQFTSEYANEMESVLANLDYIYDRSINFFRNKGVGIESELWNEYGVSFTAYPDSYIIANGQYLFGDEEIPGEKLADMLGVYLETESGYENPATFYLNFSDILASTRNVEFLIKSIRELYDLSMALK